MDSVFLSSSFHFCFKFWDWDLGLREDEVELTFLSHEWRSNFNSRRYKLPSHKSISGKHQLTEKQQCRFEMYNYVTLEVYKLKNVACRKKSVQSIKDYSIPANKLKKQGWSFAISSDLQIEIAAVSSIFICSIISLFHCSYRSINYNIFTKFLRNKKSQ